MSGLLLLIGDLAIEYLLLQKSNTIRNLFINIGLIHHPPVTISKYYWMPVVVILLFFTNKLYSKRYTFWDETREIIKSLFFAFLLTLSAFFIRKDFTGSRSIVIIFFTVSLIVLPSYRYLYKMFLSKLGLFTEKTLIIGAGNTGKDVTLGFLENREMGFKILGFIDDYKTEQEIIKIKNNEFRVLGKTDKLPYILEKSNIDTVVIAIPTLTKERLAELAATVQKHTKNFYVVPEMRGIALTNTELYHLFTEQLFLLKVNNNLKDIKNKIMKNIFDVVVSTMLLPVLIPIIMLIGVAIKIDSKGPIFFSHERIGKNGRKIKVYKFRTMYKDSQKILQELLDKDENIKKEWETTFKLKNDPRITSIGKFLRKTSLDELPQIFNVLQGNMSLVGPRPVIKDEIDKYYKSDKEFYLMVKPGITGLWQISGRSNLNYDYRVNLDKWYVLNWSLWLDIVIIFKTVKAVLKKEGAY